MNFAIKKKPVKPDASMDIMYAANAICRELTVWWEYVWRSIVTGSTPLGVENFALSHKMTASALNAIGEIGGPRCCKRDSYLSILQAVKFVKEHLGIQMKQSEIICSYSGRNNQCIGQRCPFSPLQKTKE